MDAVMTNPPQDLKKANCEYYRSLDAKHGIISRGSSGTRADVPNALQLRTVYRKFCK